MLARAPAQDSLITRINSLMARFNALLAAIFVLYTLVRRRFGIVSTLTNLAIF
jgi:hypothetical protein